MQTQLIFTCLFTGVYDVNRSETLPNDDYSLIEKWANSLASLNLHGIIFHNNFSAETVAKYYSSNITFSKVVYNPTYNLSVYRYFVYLDYLTNQAHQIDSLFITDSTDVEVLKNPFKQALFIENPNTLFCGDEPTILNNEWMLNHSTIFRNQINTFEAYEEEFSNHTLLNCGIIGGGIATMNILLRELVTFHKLFNQNNKTAYTGDMGAFNYIARLKFNKSLIHGSPVNTVFKAYEINNNTCWFKHK